MIEKISEILAVRIAEALNEKEKINILCYGLQIILNTLLSIILVIIIGGLIGKPLQALFYLFSYCSIRIWAGGYHASNHMKCIFLFVIFFILSIIGAEIIVLDKMTLCFFLILENVLLFWAAPVGTPENPIPQVLLKEMRQKAVMASLMVTFLIILQKDISMKIFGAFGIFWVVVLVLCGKFSKGGQHK